ncbi:MAG TPA: signal peptidase II [Chlamydiales bacterium]|nr:signal peptidase II [Chlamydiales bacterium]
MKFFGCKRLLTVFYLFLLCVDIASKIGAIVWIPPIFRGEYPFGGIGVFSNFFGISFSLNYIENTGAAWGMFPGYPSLLFGIRVMVILGLIAYLIFHNKKELWLIAVGAIGNALDFILYGHVIDFFHFTFWGYSFPVFNFADSYITIGALCLIFFEFFKKSPQPV